MREPSRSQLKSAQPTAKRERKSLTVTNAAESSNIELKAIELIKGAGEKGVLQIDLLKKLGINNRKGLKLISELEEHSLIRKTRELYGGKWTFRIMVPVDRLASIRWEDMDCPCFFCTDVRICSVGNVVSPSSCPPLSEWLRSFIGKGVVQAQN
ncbi:MAG: hypothetical protein WED05_03940 [Candidatus Atabeyarchaeum deiterrae]